MHLTGLSLMSPSTERFAVVVDDDALILMLASDILADAGFHTLEASSGDDAKDVIERHSEGTILLFTDVEMPGSTNGFELARYVAERWPEIEIVIASGRIAPADGDMPDKATFLSKPFSADIVRDHLRHKLPEDKKPDLLNQGA